MKTWIKRTLIGVLGAVVLLGGVAAWSHQHWGPHGWAMSDADATQWRQRLVDKAGRKLALDAPQQARLQTLADALTAQRQALLPAGGNPRAELDALLAGTQFDRARAQALVEAKTAALRDKSPAVVAAAADFFDSLQPAQQQQVRDFVAGHRRR